MKISKLPIVNSKGPNQRDRFTFITDECEKLPIPFGPRFQAEVPSWNSSFTRHGLPPDLDSSKWLGRRVWPVKKTHQVTKNKVGRGRSNICKCAFRGSPQCVRKHISEKRCELRADLGPAFWKWKFDEMGEDVSRTWGSEEEKIFEWVVKANPTPQGGNFVKSAVRFLPCQSKGSILSYYLNVYIPRRISAQTRSSCAAADTDDDIEDIPCIDIPRQIRVETRPICSTIEPLVKGSRKRIAAADTDDDIEDIPCIDVPRQIRVETRPICSTIEPLVKGSRKRIAAADTDDDIEDIPCIDIPRQIRVETWPICSTIEPLIKRSRKRIEADSLTYSSSPSSTSDGVFNSRRKLACEGIFRTGFRGCLVDELVMFAARSEA